MSRMGLLVAVVVAVSACGVGGDVADQQQPATASNREELHKERTWNPPARDCRTVSVRPAARGTVREAPMVSMLEVAPVGDQVQSMYFETSNYGPETRHGIVEFDLPQLDGRVRSASLHFTDQHGWTLQAVPSDLHKISLYGSTDGVVGIDDFVREGDVLATFTTDMNELNPVQRSFDLTNRVASGGHLGVRVELARTPSTVGSFGSGFDSFRVDLTVCNEVSLPGGQPVGDPIP